MHLVIVGKTTLDYYEMCSETISYCIIYMPQRGGVTIAYLVYSYSVDDTSCYIKIVNIVSKEM